MLSSSWPVCRCPTAMNYRGAHKVAVLELKRANLSLNVDRYGCCVKAIKVVKVITDTYNQANKTPEEIEAMISNGSVDMLRSFSEACREEFEQRLQI